MDLVLYGCLFFGLIVILYYSVPLKFQPYILGITSIVCIGALSIEVAAFSILFTALNYFLGITLERFNSKKNIQVSIFWGSIFLNVGILAFFKYFYFFLAGQGASYFHTGIYAQTPYLSVMVPMGISYYTFQSLGYLIRINRGSEQAEHNFGIFVNYLLFFPKFLSGPVERSNHFFPQLHQKIKFDQNNLRSGSRLFLWGLFKKVVIADNLYSAVSEVYGDIHDYSGMSLILILIVQIIYIYCDFSGYTDMALGLAKIFGIKLMDNFNRPFMAKNITDFWRRWHISLSSWCNDFIYNPFIIKFRRHGNLAVVSGIFVTFFIVGIWHGANWTFVILGILQGAAIIYEFYTKKFRLKYAKKFSKKAVSRFSRIVVFLFMTFSMIFFFSKNIGDARHLISHLFSRINLDLNQFNFIKDKTGFMIALICFLLIFKIEIENEKGRNLLFIYLKQPFYIRWMGYLTCLLLIYLFNSGFETFYYMRF